MSKLLYRVNVHGINRKGKRAGVFTVERHDIPSGDGILSVNGGGAPDVNETAKRLANETKTKIDVSKAEWLQVLLESIFIKDNHEFGGAEIRVASTIIDGLSTEPVITLLDAYHNIADNSYLPIGRHTGDTNNPGVNLYLSQQNKIPTFLDMRFLVIEKDVDVRTWGKLLEEIKNDNDYKSIVKAITTLVANASPYNLFVGLADAVMGVVGKVLQSNEDDQLSFFAATYTEPFDNLGIGSHKADVDNVVYKYQIRTK